MHVAQAGAEVSCTPGATQDYCACGECLGRKSFSIFRSPEAIGFLNPSTISHHSLCWQQSPSPWEMGLGRCVITLVTVWLLRAHCSAIPAPVPMIPAAAEVSGFSLASGDAQNLTPKAFCQVFGYWPVQRVLLMLWMPSPVLLSHPFASQPGSLLTAWLLALFPLLALTYVGWTEASPVCFVPCANIWVNPEGCTQDTMHFLLPKWCQSHLGDKKISTGQCLLLSNT